MSPSSPAILRQPSRIEALEATGIFRPDVPPDPAPFDRLARLVSSLLRAPMAGVTVVTTDEQRYLGMYGLAESLAETRAVPLTESFCQYVVRSGETVVIENARLDRRVRRSAGIESLGIMAYVGAPLRTAEGHVLGAVCAMDALPRAWEDREIERLVESADLAVTEIDLLGTRLRAERNLGVVQAQLERAESEAADLRRRGSLYEGIVENALEAMVAVDSKQRIVIFNASAERIFRMRAADALGGPLDRLVPERYRSRNRESIRRFLDDGQRPRSSPPGVLTGLRSDGEEFPMEVLVSRAGEGEDRVMAVIARDITRRVRTEHALRESEERLRFVVRAINDVIWEWNPETGEVHWSEGAHLTFRYTPDEMGETIEWWSDHVHPDDRERVVSHLQALTTGTGEFWCEEYRFRRGDGTYGTVLDRGFVRRNQRGVAELAVGAMMDITERRRVEETQRLLAQANALLDDSLDPRETLPGVVHMLVPEHADHCRIDLFRPEGAIHRLAAAHAVPREEGSVPGNEYLRGTSAPVGTAIAAGESVLLSVVGGRPRRPTESPDYRTFCEDFGICSLLVVPLKAHDQVLGALTLAMSTSKRRYGPMDLLLAEDLGRRIGSALENAQLYATSQSAIRARGEILRVVSHDLRNPLNAIRMSAEFLRDEAPERREENRKMLDTMIRATTQMDRMILDLLDTARIDGGGVLVEPGQQDVGTVLAETEEIFRPLARDMGLRLEVTPLPEPVTAWIDPLQIQRVLSNLIGNAIKFTPSGGRITVSAEPQDNEVLFAISDTGPGIPSQQLAHVFDPYWQARVGDRRGVGLGLAIAQGIIGAHGGRIWAESVEGEGTTFRFAVGVGAPE